MDIKSMEEYVNTYINKSAKPASTMHPDLVKLCYAFLMQCSKLGIKLKITQTYRSVAEQDALYAQGRTAPGKKITNARGGQSPHNTVVNGQPAASAFDIVCIGSDGKPDWNSPNFAKAGSVGSSVGLTWGGDFKSIKDMPHFELPNWKK